MRVCMRVGAYVRALPSCRGQQNSAGCTRSKGTQAPEQHHRTREHERPEPERLDAGAKEHKHQSRSTAGTQRTRIEKEITKTIANKFFFNFFRCIFAP